MLFQYDLYDIMSILSFIVIILQILGAIGLIIVGSSRIRKNNTINNSILFTIVGLIVALFLVLNQRIFNLILALGGPPIYESLYPILYNALFRIAPNLVSLSTFGVLFLFLGIKNKQNYGKFLMISGIFWIAFEVISIVSNSILLLEIFHFPFPYNFVLSMQFLVSITSNFSIISSVFFLIYAIKIKVKIMLFSSIVLLIASSLTVMNLFLLLIMDIM